ncbi:MAG: aromatic amino acid transport family protein [Patescibacteria group bacterium]|nr:aromatic amino acid transport family protein [Patescibacteria group bacterium]
MIKNVAMPMSLLIGTTIGAGIFSLPFVFSKAGMAVGVAYLILFSFVSFLTHLMYADIIVRTNNNHCRFPGYAKIYLGEKGSWLANTVVFTALFLTLTVYLIISASFIGLIFPLIPEIFKILIFWVFGSLAIFLGIKKAAVFESFTTLVTLSAIFIIFVLGIAVYFYKSARFPSFNLNFILFPFGPVLFSLFGEAAIPAIIVYFKKENIDVKTVRKTILYSSFITAIFYFLFVIGILGFSNVVSEDAISGLKDVAHPAVLALLGIFGFISLWDSYATIGTDIKKILEYESKIPKPIINLSLVFLPLLLYFFGFQNFLSLIGIIGGIFFSIWGIMIVLIWKKASAINTENSIIKKPIFFIPYLLLAIFIAGIIHQFLIL